MPRIPRAAEDGQMETGLLANEEEGTFGACADTSLVLCESILQATADRVSLRLLSLFSRSSAKMGIRKCGAEGHTVT